MMDVFQSCDFLVKKQQQTNSKQIKVRLAASLKQGQRSRRSLQHSVIKQLREWWPQGLNRDFAARDCNFKAPLFTVGILSSIFHPFPSSWMYNGGNTQIIWKWSTEKDTSSTHAFPDSGKKQTKKTWLIHFFIIASGFPVTHGLKWFHRSKQLNIQLTEGLNEK